jgi:hypothetical protein
MVRAQRKQKMKLQGSQASSANTLQNQSEVFAKNRFTINGLTVVHGRLNTFAEPLPLMLAPSISVSKPATHLSLNCQL